MFGRLNGVIFDLLLYMSSLLGSIFILFPFVPTAYFSPRLWRRLADRFVGYWLIFPSSLLFFLFGVKFYVSGDVIDRNRPAIIIMNHRTRLDWLFFWNALYKIDPWLLTTEKISLKSSLKRIPGAGWAMSCGAYIFMNRNYDHDRRVLKLMLKYYKDSLNAYQLLLFPEGTDRGKRAARISDEFAARNNLPRYDYVLHPRTTGFNYIFNKMREDNYLACVYDVTIGYPDRVVASEMDLLKQGRFPDAVHFDVRRYDVEEIIAESDVIPSSFSSLPAVAEPLIADADDPETNELSASMPAGLATRQLDAHVDHIDASRWLTTLWRGKEERLRRFYDPSAPEERLFEPSGSGHRWPIASQSFAYYLAFALWIGFSVFWLYWLWFSMLVKAYALIAILFFIYASRYHGGMEFLALEWFYGRRMFLAADDVGGAPPSAQ